MSKIFLVIIKLKRQSLTLEKRKEAKLKIIGGIYEIKANM